MSKQFFIAVTVTVKDDEVDRGYPDAVANFELEATPERAFEVFQHALAETLQPTIFAVGDPA